MLTRLTLYFFSSNVSSDPTPTKKPSVDIELVESSKADCKILDFLYRSGRVDTLNQFTTLRFKTDPIADFFVFVHSLCDFLQRLRGKCGRSPTYLYIAYIQVRTRLGYIIILLQRQPKLRRRVGEACGQTDRHFGRYALIAVDNGRKSFAGRA